MKQYTNIMEIPVINGDAIIVLDGRSTHVMKHDSIMITYRVSMRWWLRWLIREIKIDRVPGLERVSESDGTSELFSLRNASIE